MNPQHKDNECHINGKKIGNGKKVLVFHGYEIMLFNDAVKGKQLVFSVQVIDRTMLFNGGQVVDGSERFVVDRNDNDRHKNPRSPIRLIFIQIVFHRWKRRDHWALSTIRRRKVQTQFELPDTFEIARSLTWPSYYRFTILYCKSTYASRSIHGYIKYIYKKLGLIPYTAGPP